MVSVNKEKCDTDNIYAKINITAIQKAMEDLTASQLKVWFYFAKNQNNFVMELSGVAVCNFCSISEKTYRDTIKELINKRYLIKRENSKMYDFYEIPPVAEGIADGTLIECHTTTQLI